MNVTLNLTMETGADRAGTTARRGNDADAQAGDFRALFDEVAQATTAEQGPQPDLASADTPDDGEPDATPRLAHRRHDSDPAAQTATQETMPEQSGSDAPVSVDAAASPAASRIIAHRHRDSDAAADPADRRNAGQTDGADEAKIAPADAFLATPSIAAAFVPSGEARVAGPDAGADPVDRRDARQWASGDDGKATPADAFLATPSITAASMPSGEAGVAGLDAVADPVDHRKARQTDRVNEDQVIPASAAAATLPPVNAKGTVSLHADKGAIAASGDPGNAHSGNARRTVRAPGGAAVTQEVSSGEAGEPETAGSWTTIAASDGRTVAPDSSRQDGAAAPPKPAAVGTQSDSGGVRYWARGDSVAAFATPDTGSRRQPTGDGAKAPQDDQQTAPSRGAKAPIDVRVTASERHLAPVAVAAATKAANPADGGVAKSGMPTPLPQGDGAEPAEMASPESARAPQSNRDGAGLAPAERDGWSATVREPSDRQTAMRQGPVAARDDGIAVSESAKPSGHDTAERRQGSTTGATGSSAPRHGEDQQQAVSGVSRGSNPPAGASAPAAPLTAGVAQGIAGALAAERAATPQPASMRPDTAATARTEPVKTIALNLDMREYGQVDVRISLTGNAVNVHLKADREETAQALARDDASLREALHHAGYEAQQIQIDKRDAATPRPADATASGQQLAGGAGTGASSGHAAGGERAATPGERQQGRRDGDAFVLQDQDTHDATRQDRYRGADRLYV